MGKGNKSKGGNSNKESSKKQDRLVKRSLRKRENRLKHGDEKWKQSFNAFLTQLEPQGFYIRDVAGDGNCLFRALADQLEDNPEQHMKYRQNIVQYISINKDMFAPFIDEDENETFEEYVDEMRQNGSWGGNVEIQAASLIYQVNITIHQMNQPRWEITNYIGDRFRMIHLSYHNDEHYGSVRSLNITPAKQQQQQQEKQKGSNAPVPNMNAVLNNSYTSSNNKIDDTTFAIMNATGVKSVKLVREAMEDCQGNMEAAIDYLIALASQVDLTSVDDEVDNSMASTTTTTTTTTSTGKVSGNPYKGQKKKENEMKQQMNNSNNNNNNNVHMSNKQRKEQTQKEKESEGNGGKNRKNYNLNRNEIQDDTKVSLGSLNI